MPYNPTPAHQPYLLPQSVPAEPNGTSFQGFATSGTPVTLRHTRTVPALPSEAEDYFDVPNHRMQQATTKVGQGSSSTNSAATPMDVDADNEDSSKLDTGNGKKKDKDNSKQIQSASKVFALLYSQLPLMFAGFSRGIKKILKKQGSFLLLKLSIFAHVPRGMNLGQSM